MKCTPSRAKKVENDVKVLYTRKENWTSSSRSRISEAVLDWKIKKLSFPFLSLRVMAHYAFFPILFPIPIPRRFPSFRFFIRILYYGQEGQVHTPNFYCTCVAGMYTKIPTLHLGTAKISRLCSLLQTCPAFFLRHSIKNASPINSSIPNESRHK